MYHAFMLLWPGATEAWPGATEAWHADRAQFKGLTLFHGGSLASQFGRAGVPLRFVDPGPQVEEGCSISPQKIQRLFVLKCECSPLVYSSRTSPPCERINICPTIHRPNRKHWESLYSCPVRGFGLSGSFLDQASKP